MEFCFFQAIVKKTLTTLLAKWYIKQRRIEKISENHIFRLIPVRVRRFYRLFVFSNRLF